MTEKIQIIIMEIEDLGYYSNWKTYYDPSADCFYTSIKSKTRDGAIANFPGIKHDKPTIEEGALLEALTEIKKFIIKKQS